MKHIARTLAGLAALAVLVPAVAQGGPAKRPVVVELFTSQGCYSCPPADRFLGLLAKRPGVLALSFHVDYWNYLGWRDPYSSHEATRRQRVYSWAMRRRGSVYTPQMVIDGKLQGIGSYTGTIDGLIRIRQKAGGHIVDVALTRGKTPRTLALVVKGDNGAAGDCSVWLIYFDKSHTTTIPRGENAGKTLTYYNVVREIRKIATYLGKDLALAVPRTGAKGARYDRAAVLVQQPKGGTIVGATWTELK